MNRGETAAAITRASGSNLAASFFLLPRDRRADMETLYAFCRVVDDLSDDDARPAGERRADLLLWREAIRHPAPGESPLAGPLRAMAARRGIDPSLLEAVVDGVTSDLDTARFPDFPALRLYCWRVASAVGLASIGVFGYRDPACRDYAENLGLALQLTNILRDIGPDYAARGRIYLPLDEMARFGVAEDDLAGRATSPALRELARFQAARAEGFFARAETLLPAADRRAMLAAEMMRRVYRALLSRIAASGYRVLERRHRAGARAKLAALAAALADRFRK